MGPEGAYDHSHDSQAITHPANCDMNQKVQ